MRCFYFHEYKNKLETPNCFIISFSHFAALNVSLSLCNSLVLSENIFLSSQRLFVSWSLLLSSRPSVSLSLKTRYMLISVSVSLCHCFCRSLSLSTLCLYLSQSLSLSTLCLRLSVSLKSMYLFLYDSVSLCRCLY